MFRIYLLMLFDIFYRLTCIMTLLIYEWRHIDVIHCIYIVGVFHGSDMNSSALNLIVPLIFFVWIVSYSTMFIRYQKEWVLKLFIEEENSFHSPWSFSPRSYFCSTQRKIMTQIDSNLHFLIKKNNLFRLEYHVQNKITRILSSAVLLLIPWC